MSALTEAEYDSLTECECGHFANEHSSEGCLATDFSEDWRPISDDDKCSCSHSPTAINRHAIEAIVAAREAAAREAVLAEVEALAERMLACVGCYDEAIQDCPRHGESAAGFYIPQAADEMFALARRLREGGPDA